MYIKELLLEAVYGNMAIVYHRTEAKDIINKIYDSGFKPGNGDMYGKGFYATYDLDSQLKENMNKTYGNFIIKFAVPLDNFFFFDYTEFKKTPLAKKLNSDITSFLNDQLKYYNIPNQNVIGNETSDIALAYHKKLIGIVNGIVFTGRRDGKVLVCYNTSIIKPLSLSSDNGKTFTPYTEKLRQLIKNKVDNTSTLGMRILNYVMNDIPTDRKIFIHYIKYHSFDDLIDMFKYDINKNLAEYNYTYLTNLLCNLAEKYTNFKKPIIIPDVYYDLMVKLTSHSIYKEYFIQLYAEFFLKVKKDQYIVEENKLKKLIDDILSQKNDEGLDFVFKIYRYVVILSRTYYLLTNKLYWSDNPLFIRCIKFFKYESPDVYEEYIAKYDKYLN